MNKQIIEVPRDIRYISEWIDFPLQQLSTGHCIVNKTITGCGYTHYSLTNNQPVILCSPRKFLLENKFEQLKNNYFIYLVVNDGEKVLDIDGSQERSVKKKLESLSSEFLENFKDIEKIKQDLITYIVTCQFSNIPPKILVTYDSLKYVIEVLKNQINQYSIIVDEFQNIFMDAKFKASVELNFLEDLQDCPNVTYLSATPFIEEYLDELDEFKNLPYYELKWDPSKLRTIDVDFKKTSSINKEVDKIIDRYKSGNYPIKIDEKKQIHESREVVFYVNSVKMIKSIVKRNNLDPSEVNIICSKTKSNGDTLSLAGLTIGSAPLKGEKPFKYTFCTRTTYVGADFYSTSAISVIISDCKIDSLATDIRMDFPQIMGRQRLKENVFRNDCIFIFSLSDKTITMDQFENLKQKKLEFTQKDITNFNLLIENSGSPENMLFDLRTRIKNYKYQNDYTGISEKEGKIVFNKLVLLAEKRAFELRSNVYKTSFNVYEELNKISSENISFETSEYIQSTINQAWVNFNNETFFTEKMKILCDLFLNSLCGRISVSDLPWIPREYCNYLNYLGPEKIRALSYVENDIKNEITNLRSGSEIQKKFISTFTIGEKYSLKSIKETLRRIYQDLGLSKTPKATDLEEYFVIKLIKIYDPSTKKQSSGYLIQSLK